MKSLKQFSEEKLKDNVETTTVIPTPAEMFEHFLSITEPLPIEEASKAGQSHELDPPAVLVMRRKSVRMFPGGKRVALYYVNKINKYVTIPYEDMQWTTTSVRETIFDQLKKANETFTNIVVEHLDGTETEVTPEIAKNIIDVYKKVNETNRLRMLDMLEASAEHFKTISNFSKE